MSLLPLLLLLFMQMVDATVSGAPEEQQAGPDPEEERDEGREGLPEPEGLPGVVRAHLRVVAVSLLDLFHRAALLMIRSQL